MEKGRARKKMRKAQKRESMKYLTGKEAVNLLVSLSDLLQASDLS